MSLSVDGTRAPRDCPQWLVDVAPKLARILRRTTITTPPRFGIADIRVETFFVVTRDGTRLATDLYLPPSLPAPTIAFRTPYGRAADAEAGVFLSFARRGYAVVSQDCRGTGGSEPDHWDYYVYESEDGYDFAEWISRQSWFSGFLGSFGGSYSGQTQWPMALHPCMSTIVPSVSGLGVAVNTAHLHMFLNAYARSVGKGSEKLDVPFSELEAHMTAETLSTGYFNEPLHGVIPDALLERFPNLRTQTPASARAWLWEHYCGLGSAERAAFVKAATGASHVTIVEIESLPALFGQQISHDRHTLPHPRLDELVGQLRAPALLRTGWYDWGLNDTLATWDLLMRSAPAEMKGRSRLFIAPSAHNVPGYHEGVGDHPELNHAYTAATVFELLFRWYEAVKTNATEQWPVVTYYLMGANEWAVAEQWPPPSAQLVPMYLRPGGRLGMTAPESGASAESFVYDPANPTPTTGGSIVSYVYPPGSVDVSRTQERADVLSFTSSALRDDIDVVGPLLVILFASSSAVDTDFAARLSDVFPDGRAIQLQNGVLRARYRNLVGEPQLLEPGRIYRFEIDMWATANRFKAGHRLRVDISSADFPRFDRNTNRGGEPGDPVLARQTIYHDADHPSHVVLSIVGDYSCLS